MTRPGGTCRAIVLAAQRQGSVNPLAQRFGVSHKCLVPLAGRPLIAHVLHTLAAHPGLSEIIVSIEPEAFTALQLALEPVAAHQAPIRLIPAAANLTDSVLAATQGHDGPVLITTADHALLSLQSIDHMLTALADHDGALAMAPQRAVLAAHAEGQRRFYQFRDGGYSNCNLYGLAGPTALRAADIFRGGGQFARKTSRVIEAFGLVNLILLRLRVVSLAEGLRRVSRRLGVNIAPVILSDGSQAIDVDNDRTYAAVSQLLGAPPRQGAFRPPRHCNPTFRREILERGISAE